MRFAVENKADVVSYFDHYVPPELTEIVVDQTNICTTTDCENALPCYKTCT